MSHILVLWYCRLSSFLKSAIRQKYSLLRRTEVRDLPMDTQEMTAETVKNMKEVTFLVFTHRFFCCNCSRALSASAKQQTHTFQQFFKDFEMTEGVVVRKDDS